MFVDYLEIKVTAGKGGDGARKFRREKFVAHGGPSGGDGGDGGDVIFKVDTGMRTLMDFKYKKEFKAEDGQNGMRKGKYGRSGEHLILPVPPGTIVKNKDGVIIADLTDPGEEAVIAKGGKGGRGNKKFANSTRKTPDFYEPGFPGEEKNITIELKLIADVGLLGFPNVGKSTFLSNVTSANPKVGNYHFTTIKPNLGVVRSDYGDSFVIADIPGLINGASKGIGLGFDFLRHIERTKLLIHFVDISGFEGRDPIKDFDKINDELISYNKELGNRKQIIAANKIDLINEDNDNLERFTKEMEKRGYEVFPISAVTNKGLKPLINRVGELVKNIEVKPLYDDSKLIVKFDEDKKDKINIEKKGETYYVTGKPMVRLLETTNFHNLDSMRRFHKVLERRDVLKRLRKMGVNDGDTISIEGYELEYIE